jgi:hypothetical protein
LDARTSSSSRRPNPRASWSVVAGLLSVAAVPAGIVLARESKRVTLLDSAGSIVVGVLLGLVAIVLARRALDVVALTLGRASGAAKARVGRGLGILGLLAAAAAALALGFYGLLTLFAR